jgi:hypothetical protein
VRAFVAAALLVGGATIAVMSPPAAFGATGITEPTQRPVVVTVDTNGHAASFKVVAKGFEPYQSVFIEQCDGRPPSADHWTPTIDCDLGSAPAPAVAGTDGVATFLPTDPNHAFHPFVGASPQGLFNCLSARGKSPGNGMPDFRDCQIRVSTSNTAGTEDQVFLTLDLPVLPDAPAGATASGTSGAAGPRSGHSGPGGTVPAGTVSSELASSHSGSGGSSGLSSSDEVLIVIAAIAIGAAGFVLSKRRSGRAKA